MNLQQYMQLFIKNKSNLQNKMVKLIVKRATYKKKGMEQLKVQHTQLLWYSDLWEGGEMR